MAKSRRKEVKRMHKRAENARHRISNWLSGVGKRNQIRRLAVLQDLAAWRAPAAPVARVSPRRSSAGTRPGAAELVPAPAGTDPKGVLAIASQLHVLGAVSVDHLLSLKQSVLIAARQICLSGVKYKVRAAGGGGVTPDAGTRRTAPGRMTRVALPVRVDETAAVELLGITAGALRAYLCQCNKPPGDECGLRLLDSTTVPAFPSRVGQGRHADHTRVREIVTVVICTDMNETVTTLFAIGSHHQPLTDFTTPLKPLSPSKCVAFDARVSHAAAASIATRVQPGRWFLSFFSQCLAPERVKDVLHSNFSAAAAQRYDAAYKLGPTHAAECIEKERNVHRGAAVV